jgi:multiple sugar transport system permease protein/raffinose/stachyose/melibiose transport system permease protein
VLVTRGSRVSLLLMAAGPLAFFLVFVLWPLAQSMYYSLTKWNGLSDPVFIGLDNFSRAAADPNFIRAFQNTAIWLIVAVAIPTILGLLLAVLLDRPLRGSRLYKSAFYLPITLSLVVVGQVWIWIYQPDWGLLNSALESVGLADLTRAWLGDPETALIAVILAWCWQQTALALILYLAALTTVPRDLLEAAAIDGANARQQFLRIIVPLLRPASVVVITLAVINTLKGFDIVFVLTKGGPFHMSTNLAMLMYEETFFKYQLGYGAAIATALFALAIVVVVVYFRQVRASERLYG